MTVIFAEIPKELPREEKISAWIQNVIEQHQKTIGVINIYFITQEEIQLLHKHYFNDPEPTDIITLNYNNSQINGDLYICKEFIEENLQNYDTNDIQNALLRVIIHGVLHLLGYDDLTEKDRNKMILAENEALAMSYEQYL